MSLAQLAAEGSRFRPQPHKQQQNQKAAPEEYLLGFLLKKMEVEAMPFGSKARIQLLSQSLQPRGRLPQVELLQQGFAIVLVACPEQGAAQQPYPKKGLREAHG